MTVKELIELNQNIVDVVIEVRENGNLLVDKLNIGPDAGAEPPHPTIINSGRSNQHKALYIRKSINAWDDRSDYWQVKPDRIPDKWTSLEVFAWRIFSPYKGHHQRDDFTHSMEGILITALPSGQSLQILQEKMKKEEKQLEGQTDIFNFLGDN